PLAPAGPLPAFDLEIPAQERGSYLLAIKLTLADGSSVNLAHPAPLALVTGIREEVAALDQRVAALKQKLASGREGRADGRNDDERRSLDLLDLPADLLRQVERGARTFDEVALPQELLRADELASAL